MEVALLVAFAITFAGILIVPGPNTAFAVAQSLNYGVNTALAVSFGFMCATGIHAILVFTGVGAVITAYPIILAILKMAGVAYLLYLALITFGRKPVSREIAVEKSSKSKLYFFAMAVSLSNPKALLSSVMIYPLFISPENNYGTQAVVISLLAMTISFVIYTGYILAAAHFKKRLYGSRIVNRVVGGVYIGAAGVLATK